MASDSDLEAYLNQLSKKAHNLKKDGYSFGYGSSRPTSAEDNSELLEISDESSLQHGRQSRKYGLVVTTSDITALSEKYGGQSRKTGSIYGGLSNLEEKYLRKPQKKKTSRTDSSIEKDRKDSKAPAKRSGGHSHFQRTANDEDASADSLVDDELARYLNESSITESDPGKGKPSQIADPDQSSEDESDDILNLNNIMTVDDILGPSSENDNDGRPHERVSNEGDYELEKDLNFASGDLLHEDSEESSTEESKKIVKSLFRKPSTSCFYPDTEVEEEHHLDKQEGVLFTEIPHKVFHSSRRNSLMATPVLMRKSSMRSLASASIQDQALVYEGEDSSDRSSAESIVENIIPLESSIAESVPEKSSEKYTEDFEASETGRSSAKGNSKPKSHVVVERSDKPHKARRKAAEEFADDDDDGERNTTRHNSDDRNIEEDNSGSDSQESSHDDGASTRPEKKNPRSHKKTTRSHSRSRKKSKRKGKRKHKRRSSTSSSSSSSVSSSSSSSSSDYERERHRKHERRKHKHRKNKVNPWAESPYVYPWWWMQSQPPSSLRASSSYYIPRPNPMEAWNPLGLIGVDDIMRQQVALTRQFMDSQQALYHAYTATLTSSYRYTSLKDTEKFIKKKKQPMTFDEAYRLVKEEMGTTSKTKD